MHWQGLERQQGLPAAAGSVVLLGALLLAAKVSEVGEVVVVQGECWGEVILVVGGPGAEREESEPELVVRELEL